MIAVDLYPRGPFHVGELGVGREETLTHVPSDTLYAAMVTAWVAQGNPGPFDLPPLRLTSAFPRVGTLRLYPRPFIHLNVEHGRRDALGKILTKLAWCSERIFALLIQGEEMTSLADKKNFVGGVWFHPDDLVPLLSPPFWETQIAPHVTIDRLDNAPNLFHNGRMVFGPDCGLWFGVEYIAPDAPLRLEKALDYLADAGLGGLRSTGHGGFSFNLNEIPLPMQKPSGYGVTLSRYLPADPAEIITALKADHAAYKLVHVGGWCQDDAGHPWRRKQVRLVREGSVLGWDGAPLGRIADIKPDEVGQFGDRSVLRYGLGFLVPVAQEALL